MKTGVECSSPGNNNIDRDGLDPGTPEFWYSIRHVIDVAKKGAMESGENSREYWAFCSIIGELVVLMGDERFDLYTRVEKRE